MLYKNTKIIDSMQEYIEENLKEDLIEFAKWLEYKGLLENTITSYLNDIKQALIFFANAKGNKISLENLINLSNSRYLSLLSKYAQEKSFKTQERMIATWKKWSEYKRTQKIETIFEKTIYPKSKHKILPNIEFETIEKLIDTQENPETWEDYRNRALIVLLYSAGIRINEAINLSWQDINLSANWAQIRGKGNKIRYVPLLESAKTILLEYKAALNKAHPEITSDKIFISSRLKKWHACTAERFFRQLIQKHNLPKLTPHSLRHACATHLLKSGCNLRTIQSLLGHANLETTKMYIQHSTEELMDIHSKIINKSKQ